MIRLKVKNPNFAGERVGIRFRNGEAEVPELTGAQRQALTRLGVTIEEPERPLVQRTVKELRELAEVRGVDLGNARTKAEILAALDNPPEPDATSETEEPETPSDPTDQEDAGDPETGDETVEEVTDPS